MSRFLQGREKAMRRFAAIPKAMRKELAAAVTKSANELASYMKSVAPRDEGDLIRSIDVVPGGYGKGGGDPELTASVVAGRGLPGKGYAVYVEHGTSDTRPRPFFYPVYRALRKKIRGRLSRAGRKGAIEAFKK